MGKINLVLLFGGQSSEHDISRLSASTIISYIDIEIFNIYPVGITKEGKWLLYSGEYSKISDDNWYDNGEPAIISPDATDKSLIIFAQNTIKKVKVDVVFPALHGLYGEDGSIQGLLEIAKIPYVGCGILASSVSMDKIYTKIIVEQLGIRQAKYIIAYKEDVLDYTKLVTEVTSKLGYPVFVKPSNAGSSMGITKAHDEVELIEGITLAFEHDRKVLIEENIVGREIECAVLGNYNPKASGVGEIVSAEEFYDFDAKYNNEESKTSISPEMPKEIEKKIREYSVKIFKAVDGTGLSRVDFFVENETNEIVFNEINTLPGFTGISMYPMLWEEKGMKKKQLVDKLIRLALQRFS
jgi:D-alanine-D-alanine ligase